MVFKVYDGASDDLKLNGVYEFIGVLSRAPELAVAHMDAAGGCSCGPASDAFPVVHVPGCRATQTLLEDEMLGRSPTSLVRCAHEVAFSSLPTSLHRPVQRYGLGVLS